MSRVSRKHGGREVCEAASSSWSEPQRQRSRRKTSVTTASHSVPGKIREIREIREIRIHQYKSVLTSGEEVMWQLASACLSVCFQDNSKFWILMEFPGSVDHGSGNRWWHFSHHLLLALIIKQPPMLCNLVDNIILVEVPVWGEMSCWWRPQLSQCFTGYLTEDKTAVVPPRNSRGSSVDAAPSSGDHVYSSNRLLF